MARGLKEVIKIYGQDSGKGAFTSGGCGLLDELVPPFYCGMSYIMLMPEFGIRLTGPTSTSVQLECATNFGGEEGIIIQLDNNTRWGQEVRGFDVSFISRYGGQESEVYESIYLYSTHYISHFTFIINTYTSFNTI